MICTDAIPLVLIRKPMVLSFSTTNLASFGELVLVAPVPQLFFFVSWLKVFVVSLLADLVVVVVVVELDCRFDFLEPVYQYLKRQPYPQIAQELRFGTLLCSNLQSPIEFKTQIIKFWKQFSRVILCLQTKVKNNEKYSLQLHFP